MSNRLTTKTPRRKRGLGRLYKRGKDGKEYPPKSRTQGHFYIEFRVDGKRVRQRLTDNVGQPITTIREAQEARDRVVAPLAAKDKVDKLQAVQARLQAAKENLQAIQDDARPPLSIQDAWNAYKLSNERPDSGDVTLKSYVSHWRQFKTWLSDNHPDCVYLRDVTTDISKRYMDTFKGSPNTYNKHVAFLRLLYSILKEPGRVQKNPFEKIKRKRLKTESRRALSVEELQSILSEATGDLEVLLALGTFTGLRLGDCCTLQWGEADLVAGVIRRVPNKIRSRKNTPVVVGIPPMLAALLNNTPKNKRRGYLLPEVAQQYIKNSTGITRIVQAHFQACGIQTHKEGTGIGTGKRAVVEVGFHSLRHSYVSLHAERGTPQAVIQAVVGHSNPQMTQSYTHISEGVARELSGVIELDGGKTHKEPLPSWAVELVSTMTVRNWKKVKQELLAAPGL